MKHKIKLGCLDCGFKFSRVLTEESEEDLYCPKCKSQDIDLNFEEIIENHVYRKKRG